MWSHNWEETADECIDSVCVIEASVSQCTMISANNIVYACHLKKNPCLVISITTQTSQSVKVMAPLLPLPLSGGWRRRIGQRGWKSDRCCEVNPWKLLPAAQHKLWDIKSVHCMWDVHREHATPFLRERKLSRHAQLQLGSKKEKKRTACFLLVTGKQIHTGD